MDEKLLFRLNECVEELNSFIKDKTQKNVVLPLKKMDELTYYLLHEMKDFCPVYREFKFHEEIASVSASWEI